MISFKIKCFNAFILKMMLLFSIQPSFLLADNRVDAAAKKLSRIHSQLLLLHGKFYYEYPEQLITAMFLPSDAKVLELGSNLGNNSLVISSILSDSRNLVTLETRKDAVQSLKENRDVNRLKFHIEWAALSKVPLIQKGWITIPSDVDMPGYFRVNTISFSDLQEKYKIKFDTLVVDAEGALYQILIDDPEILKDIKLIIIENDFQSYSECQYTLDLFRMYGLELIYNEGNPYYGENAFNQVWARP